VAARPGAVDEELDDNVTDMRSTLVAGFEEHLRSLSECGRCVSDKDEKCLDRWLAGEEWFSIDDVECGCGCWTRTAYPVQLGLGLPTDRRIGPEGLGQNAPNSGELMIPD